MIDNKEIDKLFKELGYIKKVFSENNVCYVKGNIYCKIEHNSGLNAYILCSAESLKDAELNLFEDNELYSDLLEDKTFLDSLKSDLIEFFE